MAKPVEKHKARIEIRIPEREKNKIIGLAELHFGGNMTEFIRYCIRKSPRPMPKNIRKSANKG